MKPSESHTTFKLRSYDNISLMGHCWAQKKQAKCIIILVHGLGGHGLRYSEWAIQLSQYNYTIYAVDLRGHGQSEGPQGDAKSIYEFIYDIEALTEHINKSVHKQLPKFIYGNSMGGLLAVLFAQKNPQYLRGMVLAAPWFKLTNPPTTISMLAIRLLVLIIPAYRIKTGVSSDKLRSNKNERIKAQLDPYVHKNISLRLFNSIVKLTKQYILNTPQVSIPLFGIHGKNDQVTAASQTKVFFEKQKGSTELILLNNAYHEIHLEDEGKNTLSKMNQWINHRT